MDSYAYPDFSNMQGNAEDFTTLKALYGTPEAVPPKAPPVPSVPGVKPTPPAVPPRPPESTDQDVGKLVFETSATS